MKQKTFSSIGKLWGIAVLSLLTVSCAQDGFDDETFSSSVTNETLTSPELTKANFSTKVGSNGNEQIQVTWDVVFGAGGYACRVLNVDNPSQPVEILNDTIDGTSFTFPKAEDTNYEVSVKTLGNSSLNNKDAAEATIFAYSTMIEAKIIPAGSDIAQFVASNLQASDEEQAFELEAGANYTLNEEVDFQDNLITLRGNKVNHPVVTMGSNGVIRTATGLKIKWINFDCAEQSNKGGVIEASANPPASASAEARGIVAGKNSNKPADVYIISEPIVIQDCAFKDVRCALFFTGDYAWSVKDIRVDNCVVQINNDGKAWKDAALFCTVPKTGTSPSGGSFWNTSIKDITIKNSTFFNIAENLGSNNRFIRFGNKDVDRSFPTADGSATFENVTFYKTFVDKEFGNNTPNQNKYIINFNNNICFDIFRLQKFIQNSCTINVNQASNSIWCVTNEIDSTDKSKWATEDPDMSFVGPCDQSLDFSKPNYGVNFKATSALSSTIGDPRWRE